MDSQAQLEDGLRFRRGGDGGADAKTWMGLGNGTPAKRKIIYGNANVQRLGKLARRVAVVRDARGGYRRGDAVDGTGRDERRGLDADTRPWGHRAALENCRGVIGDSISVSLVLRGGELHPAES